MGDAAEITETLNGQFKEVFWKSLEWGDFEKAGTDDRGLQDWPDLPQRVRTSNDDAEQT